MTDAAGILFAIYSALSLLTMWLMGDRRLAGPIVGLISQVILAWATSLSGYHGFWLLVAGMTGAHCRNLWIWRTGNDRAS